MSALKEDEDNELTPEKQLLKDFAAKSWNMELIISGAAVVLTTALPSMTDEFFDYYLHHLAPDSSDDALKYPLLAYAFLKVMTLILAITFIVHLIIRGFWIGLIGLIAVYPNGIQYDKLINMAPAQQQFAKKEFGSLDAYVHRLDKICNLLFALAFMVALMSIGIAFCYLIFFGVIMTCRTFFSASQLVYINIGLLSFFSVFAGSTLFATWWTKRREDHHPKWSRYLNWVSKYAVMFMMPFVHRPMKYIFMTFSSNVQKKTYYMAFIGLMSAMMLAGIWVMTMKLGELKSRNLGELRSFYGRGASNAVLCDANYDNLRSNTDIFPNVSMSQQMNEGSFVPFFVAYPLSLDQRIRQLCTPIALSDTISRSRRVVLGDSLKLDCLNRFFKIKINDTTEFHAEWMFERIDNHAGLRAFIPGKMLREGKNVLIVQVPSQNKPDSLEIYGELPFWYSL